MRLPRVKGLIKIKQYINSSNFKVRGRKLNFIEQLLILGSMLGSLYEFSNLIPPKPHMIYHYMFSHKGTKSQRSFNLINSLYCGA